MTDVARLVPTDREWNGPAPKWADTTDEDEDDLAEPPLGRYSDLPGEEWRPVLSTGLGSDELLVSREGRVRTKGGRRTLGAPHYGSLNQMGYRSVYQCGKRFRVHYLVCCAFRGQPPTPKHTADHKNGNRSDNRACNLRWATQREQVKNQRKHRPKSNGKPVLARRVASKGEWTEYPSGKAAAKALLVNRGSVSKVLNCKVKQTGGYAFKWAPAREPQTDLPAEGTKPAELWEDASDSLKVSNRGRVQSKHAYGGTWSHRYTAVPAYGSEYAQVKHLGADKKVHRLVWQLFGKPALKLDETVDHKDRDKTNNSIDNLRPATKKEQKANQTLQHTSQIGHARKSPVRGKPVGGSREWETFESLNEAARALNARFPGKKFTSGGISDVARGAQETHNGWMFQLVR